MNNRKERGKDEQRKGPGQMLGTGEKIGKERDRYMGQVNR